MIHELFGVDELQPGQMRSIRVDGIAILVIRTPAGDYRALRDVCPHLGVALSRGTTQYVVNGDDVGDYRWGDVYVARCSWHAYEFDVENGRCVSDSRWRVKTYPITVADDGRLMLER